MQGSRSARLGLRLALGLWLKGSRALGVVISFNFAIIKYMQLNSYIQKTGLGLSIIIVLNLLFNYSIFSFYPSPDMNDFCGAETRKYYDNKKSCEAVGGEWVAYSQGPYARPVPIIKEEFEAPKEYCNAAVFCREQYDEARNLHNRNVFISLVSLGAIALIVGFFFISVSTVSSGFIFGGLLSFFIGTVRYWSGMDDYLRLVVLLIVLASLIWVGYRKLK